MRIWLMVLMAVGVGTAAGMQWWRARSLDARSAISDDEPVLEVGEAVDTDSGSGEEPIQIEAISADVAAVGDAPDDIPVAAERADGATNAVGSANDPEDSNRLASAPSGGEVEIPGGSPGEADGEARLKAESILARAAKASSPVEQAQLLTQAIRSGALDGAAEARVYAQLLEANQRGILNPRVDDLCMRTEVLPGDSLWKICRRAQKDSQVQVAPGLLRLVNGLSSDAIYPGATLKIPSVPLSVLVEKSRFRVSVFLGEILLRRYEVGLGVNNRTPEGEFTIASRLKDPPWFKPGVGEVPPNDPENILGTRWLGFGAKDGFPEAATFGIHGTRDETSIGKESSNGCVRMRNRDVEELFEWVPEGVKVRIVP